MLSPRNHLDLSIPVITQSSVHVMNHYGEAHPKEIEYEYEYDPFETEVHHSGSSPFTRRIKCVSSLTTTDILCRS